jgi:predicted  nucleic acid-binding Zn-ribbon protein
MFIIQGESMEDKTFALLEKMYSEFLGFKSEMLSFKEDTNKRFDNIDKKFDGIDKRFEDIDKRFEDIDKRFEGIDNTLQKIEIKIDGDITPKIDALFDGYNANSEKLDELNDKLEVVQYDINNLSMKVACNDNRIIEIKRDLKRAK